MAPEDLEPETEQLSFPRPMRLAWPLTSQEALATADELERVAAMIREKVERLEPVTFLYSLRQRLDPWVRAGVEVAHARRSERRDSSGTVATGDDEGSPT